ncbi:related to 30S ribosomal protein S16 [Melanopsichium pennsylvanicum]|uniref:Related to 30S ribosomal protein S16 n=2 Tax=Melanopsichium pennsylvanicum TaxID=63383 RepID=A0AAJ4XHZ1_9BASI|nr:related to 30S ribosomal protein S16 [Melanopsichium pennsylvanicum 4]SNX82450.1 related to 30S ribosomal protein S16 [Melanopsichium pennsylvanicum]
MVVRIRMSRQGTRNSPFYHIVAINHSKPRDARPIEKLGEFDPIPRPIASTSSRLPTPFAGSLAHKNSSLPGHGGLMTSGLAQESKGAESKLQKRLEWNENRIKHWLQLGAQPSKPVARLLDRAGLVPPGVHYKGIYRPPASQMTTPPASPKNKSS